MEIVLFTRRPLIRDAITKVVNSTLKYRRGELASLHPEVPETEESLKAVLRKGKSYLIVADLEEDPGRLEACRRAGQGASFLMVGGRAVMCVQAVRWHLRVVDFVREGDPALEGRIAAGIEYLLDNMCAVGKGLFAVADHESVLIPFEDIYYIETIKRTHLCSIRHTRGEATLRANIRDLIGALDARFYACSSSTIANFSQVQHIDYSVRNLFFTDQIQCGFSASNQKAVKLLMSNRLRPYFRPE